MPRLQSRRAPPQGGVAGSVIESLFESLRLHNVGVSLLGSVLECKNKGQAHRGKPRIEEIRGHANFDRPPFKGCFLVPPIRDCTSN